MLECCVLKINFLLNKCIIIDILIMQRSKLSAQMQYERNVNSMTSREFCADPKSHLENNKFILKDKVRYMHYKDVFMQNRHVFINKVLLDIQCGLGMLSLIAAKAGAAKVFAVDSSNVTHYTRRIVKDNKYNHVIEVIKSTMDDLHLPCKVDIIISDWMGYGLLFQSCADAVITARDKWLKKGGLILPSKAHLYLVAIENATYRDTKIDWWNDVYGFKMDVFRDWILSEPVCQQVPPTQVVSNEFCVTTIDLYTDKVKDLQFKTKFILNINIGTKVDAFATYFKVVFKKLQHPLHFSTSPFCPQTVWMQHVYNIDEPIYAQIGDALYGGIQMRSSGEAFDPNKMTMAIDVFKGHPSTSLIKAKMRYKLDAGVGQTFYFGKRELIDKDYKNFLLKTRKS